MTYDDEVDNEQDETVVSDMESDISTIQSDISAIQSDVSKLADKFCDDGTFLDWIGTVALNAWRGAVLLALLDIAAHFRR